ncbi:uridine kinase [Actinopolymorpha sp. NPDC004070]|uniref:uridine kinase n=1 Tax=Actinopolymorpha sp. NPDC004070 TaxID=3154548 RepID=UPI0033A47CEC
MRVRAISPALLVTELADTIARLPTSSDIDAGAETGAWTRVAVDGAPATNPDRWADALIEPLRERGRAVVRVRADDYLRPASLRLERGREDPDVLYEDWLDDAGLVREVLEPLDPGGTGRVLPALWNARTDRAHRADYVTVAPGGLLVLSGSLLLGRWLPIDFVVHLELSPAALARQTPAEQQWMLPAYDRYAAEAEPTQAAQVVVRLDNPERPAVVEHSAD